MKVSVFSLLAFLFFAVLPVGSVLGAGASDGDSLYQEAVSYHKQDRMREALALYKQANAAGNLRATLALGQLYDKGRSFLQDSFAAFKYYHEAAEKGLAEAQFNVATMYLSGDGVDKDVKEAINWFKRAIEGKDSNAAFNLGVIYYNGIGVDQNEAEAEKWFAKAKALGNPLAAVVTKIFGHDVNLIARNLNGV